MKDYPSIPKLVATTPAYCFDKSDGSLIRAHWSRKKRGLTGKFGSRTQLIDETHLTLAKSIPLIKEQEDLLSKILYDKFKQEEATLFFEFFGKSSFAGVHVQEEPHKSLLIDINLYKYGMIQPNEFVRQFSEKAETAPLLYYGNCNSDLVKSVQNGTLAGMTFEGVVCKTTRSKPSHPLTYFKIKSDAWISKVKSLYSNDPKLLESLL